MNKKRYSKRLSTIRISDDLYITIDIEIGYRDDENKFSIRSCVCDNRGYRFGFIREWKKYNSREYKKTSNIEKQIQDIISENSDMSIKEIIKKLRCNSHIAIRIYSDIKRELTKNKTEYNYKLYKKNEL